MASSNEIYGYGLRLFPSIFSRALGKIAVQRSSVQRHALIRQMRRQINAGDFGAEATFVWANFNVIIMHWVSPLRRS